MIVRTQTVRFTPDRAATPRRVKIGVEGDNMVERLCFKLPRIAENQTATMMLDGEYANMVILTEDEDRYYVDLTAELIGGDGEHEAYIVIDGGDTGEAWGSGTFTLQVGEIPGFAGDIAERFPDAIEQLRGEIAGHRAEMEQMTEEIAASADEAQEAAADTKDWLDATRSWAQSADNSAAEAERHANRAEQYRGDVYEILEGGDDGQVLGNVDGEPTWIDLPEVGNGDVSTDALAAAIARHNASGGAHPDIRAMIGASGGGTGGVHVGSDQPDGDQNVWIDPEGEAVEVYTKAETDAAIEAAIKEDNYELLSTVTVGTGGASQITFPDVVDLSAVMACITMPISNNVIGIFLQANISGVGSYVVGSSYGSKDGKYSVRLEMHIDKGILTGTAQGNVYGWGSADVYGVNNAGSAMFADKIKTIHIYCPQSDRNILEGTDIKIYGVRA